MLTPNRKAFDGDGRFHRAPGDAGYLGVLAHHAPLITTVQAGDLKVRYEGDR